MLILHATWPESLGELHLWAEDPSRSAGSPTEPADATLRHPFAADLEHLGDVLGGVLQGVVSLSELEIEDVPLLLPSSATSPRSSAQLLRDDAVEVEAVEALAAWSVPVFMLPAAAASAALSHLRDPDGLAGARIALSPSVLCLAEVERLSRRLASRGAWVPSLQEEGGDPVARWRPFGLTGAEQGALQALAQALPASARAELPWGDAPSVEHGWTRHEAPSPLRVVRSALQTFVDHHVRTERGARFGEDRSWRSAVRRHAADRTTIELLTALTSDYPMLDGAPAEEIEALRQRLHSWTAAARIDAPFRTCFRLVPPDLDEAVDPSEDWAVEFTLQSRDDPSLFAPAADVWAGAASAQLLATAGADPQEHLLASLGIAARLHAPLETSLKQAAPCGLTTDAVGAWSFLKDGVPPLEQAGFGVLVPPWWGDRRAGLGLKLRARSKTQRDADALGGEMSGRALLEFSWSVAIGDDELSEDELRAMAAAKVPLVRVRGRWVEVRPDQVAAALEALQAQGDGVQELGAVELLQLASGLHAGPGGLPVLGAEADGALGKLLVDGMRPAARRTPTNFVGSLRSYQARGHSWLAFLEECGLGACLADDMGLGKTVQVLALLAAERTGRKARTAAGRPGATLLVCPLSVVGNWAKEAARFVPSLKVSIHHGAERLAGEALAEQIDGSDLMITTYALATRDREELGARRWHRVVLDEAQAIKNPGTRQSRAMRSLVADRRAALTGTPVENRLSELHSIMDFLNPGLLGSAAGFRRSFVLPIERDSDTAMGERLRRVTRPFVLRRLKTDPTIAPDLPDKVEQNVECSLTREQVTLYQAVVDELDAELEGAEGMKRRGAILAAMTKLKQVCDHPALFLADRSALDGRSGKLARTEELLEEALAAGDTVILFTQYAEMGKLLRSHLQERFGEEVMLLHGAATRAARERMVERFQSPGGPRIFVLSLLAAGTGLNLTAANHVIHFDRWWNPAVEDQATDRTYRIGQHRNVLVHKLVCAGTLEERIDAMIQRKRALADLVVGAGEDWLTELSTDEIRSVVALSASALRED